MYNGYISVRDDFARFITTVNNPPSDGTTTIFTGIKKIVEECSATGKIGVSTIIFEPVGPNSIVRTNALVLFNKMHGQIPGGPVLDAIGGIAMTGNGDITVFQVVDDDQCLVTKYELS